MKASQYDGTPVVYRCYGRHGVLLYVGQTVRLSRRLWEHRTMMGPSWFSLVAEITVDPFSSVDAAKVAETAAIASETPLVNEVGQRSWHSGPGRPPVAIRPHLAPVPA